MDYKYLVAPLSKTADDDSDNKWELIIEAMASTPDVDRGGDVVLPTAFAKTMPEFMKNPVMFFNHNPMLTIGQVLEYKIGEDGLWIRGGIDGGTQAGKEVAHLIRVGIIKSMSFSYRNLEVEAGQDDSPSTIKELEVFEIGPVSIPMNTQALIEAAKAQNIEIKSLTSSSEAGGQTTEGDHAMEEKKVREVVDASVTPVAEESKKQGVKIGEVEQKLDGIVKIQNELKDASESGTKTSGDLRELIDKMTGDFQKAVDGLTTEVTKIQNQKRVTGLSPIPMSTKDLVALEPLEVRTLYPHQEGQIAELRKYNDAVVMADAMKCTESLYNRGSYHLQSPAERMKSMPEFLKLNEFAKALDTATTTEGLELIPTEFSGEMKELIRLQLKVAPLIEKVTMPNKSFKLPVEAADIYATIAGETTAVVSAFDSTEQTPTSGNTTLTAEKLRVRVQVSAETIEDSVIPIMPWVQKMSAKGLARSIDRMLINGQETGAIDLEVGGGAIASTDARKMVDGFRYHYISTMHATLGVDMGTFTDDNLRNVFKPMGVYGIYPDDVAILCSAKCYLGHFLKDLDDTRTVDKYGPKATVLAGELMKYDNKAVIVSEFIQDDLNASGVYDDTTKTKTTIIVINRSGWVLGERSNMKVEVVKDGINDVFTVVTFWRGDFQPFWTPSTSIVTVNGAYNIS
jgi:HK97 family phage major capsid protein/HK97 family phage prohead protease